MNSYGLRCHIFADLHPPLILLPPPRRETNTTVHQYYPREFPERAERLDPSQAARIWQVFEVELGLHGFRKAIRFNAGGRDVVSYVLATFKSERPELLPQIQRSTPFTVRLNVVGHGIDAQLWLTIVHALVFR